jgi:hypothetical protein
MIIRRFVTALRQQDWATVTIEFVLVVLGVFVGIQASNWNESIEIDRKLDVAMRRVAAEMDLNLNRLEALDKEIEGALPLVRRAHDALLSCSQSDGAVDQINEGINASMMTFGMIFELQALDAVLGTPEFVERIEEPQRTALARFSSYLKSVETDITANEKEPFHNGAVRAPSVTFGPNIDTTFEYSGESYRLPLRGARLRVPVSEACLDNHLMKGLWLWERLQKGAQALAKATALEIALQREILHQIN